MTQDEARDLVLDFEYAIRSDDLNGSRYTRGEVHEMREKLVKLLTDQVPTVSGGEKT